MNKKQLSKTFTIKNKLGLHARAAAVLVKTTSMFLSDIKIIKDGVEADGKSILGILSFAATKGTNITVLTDGEDADIALNTIEELIESGFGEGV
ncbi:MAG: HPr family phosphocarrier protein [Candidatus Dadabacteria bacterium]|nr:HPr family phosphocarrier protein [Candidatus Dadabacteria bacterium]